MAGEINLLTDDQLFVINVPDLVPWNYLVLLFPHISFVFPRTLSKIGCNVAYSLPNSSLMFIKIIIKVHKLHCTDGE